MRLLSFTKQPTYHVPHIFEDLFNQPENFLRSVLQPFAPSSETLFASNVYENDLSYRIESNAVGYAQEDLSIEVKDHLLTVSAKLKSTESDQETRKSRSFRLPKNANFEQIEASLENGLLTIVIQKSAKPSTRNIQIENN